jgi:hypothetical protein
LYTFFGVFALAGRSGGLSDVAHKEPQAFGGRDDFSDIFFHGMRSQEDYFHCAPLGVNSLQFWPDLLARFGVCFVGFRDGAEIWGLDGTEVVPLQDG